MANELIKDIQPRGIASAYVVAPFDKGKSLLEANGYYIISLEENAKLRMQEGRDAYVSKDGNWNKEGFLYIPKKGKFLTKNSPVMVQPAEATEANRRREDFYLTSEQVETGLANSIKLKNKNFSIPTNKFGEEEIPLFAFGNFAKDYGYFLKEVGINEILVYMVDNIGDKPFVRQAWLDGLDDGSGLGGSDRDLGDGGRVRGISEDALASEPLQKNLYKPRDLEILKKVRTGDIAPKELEKILSRFQ